MKQNKNSSGRTEFSKQMLFSWKGTCKKENISPDPDETTKFWSYIWSVPSSTYKQDASCLQKVRQELDDVEKLGDINITEEIGSTYVKFEGS